MEATLAIWNETGFEKNLKVVLEKEFGSEEGEEYMSRYITARTTLLEDVLEEIRGAEPDLTDHGPTHIRHVLENVFKLLGNEIQHFSAMEHYILGLSVLFHDVGNLHGRNGHNRRIGRFHDHVRKNRKLNQEKFVVVQIAQAHTGEARDGTRNTLSDVPPMSQLDGEPIRAREIAAIVRFADELAEGTQRTSKYMQEHHLYSSESVPFHEYAAATDIAIDKANERIAITYQLRICTKSGLEEELSRVKKFVTTARGRLEKMDMERRYARIHCPAVLLPFQKISVCLNVQVDGDFLDPSVEAVISDEVDLSASPDLSFARANSWDPDVIADRVREKSREITTEFER